MFEFLQALKKQDARAICVVLQAIGYLAKQNLSQGIHVLLETGLLNILGWYLSIYCKLIWFQLCFAWENMLCNW